MRWTGFIAMVATFSRALAGLSFSLIAVIFSVSFVETKVNRAN